MASWRPPRRWDARPCLKCCCRLLFLSGLCLRCFCLFCFVSVVLFVACWCLCVIFNHLSISSRILDMYDLSNYINIRIMISLLLILFIISSAAFRTMPEGARCCLDDRGSARRYYHSPVEVIAKRLVTELAEYLSHIKIVELLYCVVGISS